MNKLEATILAGLAKVIDDELSRHLEPQYGLVSEAYREKYERKRLAERQIADVDLSAFIGRKPTGSERVMASRAYKSLEDRGFVSRIFYEWSDRTAQLRLTAEGRAALQGEAATSQATEGGR